MSRWSLKPLGEICSTTSGGTPSRSHPEYFGGAIPWIKSGDLTDGDVIACDENITEEAIRSSSAKLFPQGTVLVAMYGATVGKLGMLGMEAATNQAVCGITPSDELDRWFLFYFLLSQRQNLIGQSAGGAQPNISQKIVRELLVPVPPLPEQRRIVDLLSRAEGIVRLRREAEKKAAELIPALFLDMFGDPGRNPKGWPVAAVGNLASVQTGATPSRENLAYYFEAKIPWVKTGEVNGGIISETEEKISELALSETNCKIFPVGTILVAMYGQGKTRGRAAVLGIPAATNQACAAILPSSNIETDFLFVFLQTQYEQLRAMAHGGNQANLNLSMIKGLSLIVPPIAKQQQFSQHLDEIRSIQSQQATATAKAQATFDALLAQTFSDDHR